MKQIVFLLILTSFFTSYAETQEPTAHHTEQRVDDSDRDSVDVLLDDARQNPDAQDMPEIKPVSCVEFWIRKIGACIVINCIQFKQYIMHQMGLLHEKKDIH